MENEIWKDVVGFEGRYQVSNLGRVKLIWLRGKPKDRVMKIVNNKIGLGSEPTRKDFRVDVLVAKAFLPDSEMMEIVKHLDNDQNNNRADNLAWSSLTRAEYISEIMTQNARKSPNEWFEKNNYVYFKLSNCNEYGVCDKDIWEKAKKYRWACGSKNYVLAEINKRTIRFHHLVVGRKQGYVVDHINRNPFDNRRENLRFATLQANAINRGKGKNNTSGVCGVCQRKHGKYRAYITVNKHRICLGDYESLEEAKLVRQEAEEKYFKPIIEKETHI